MLSLSVSEEFFVVQMPLLVLVLGGCLRTGEDHAGGRAPHPARLCASGAGVALATCVSVHNVVLLAGLCAWLTGLGGRWRGLAGLRRALCLGVGGAAVLAPAFAAAYLAGPGDAGPLRWLVSYQGASDTEVSRLYGFNPTLRDATIALARLGFAFVNNVAEGAGAGTLGKAALRGGTLEYVPNAPLAALGAAVLLATAAALGALLAWMWRRRREELVLLTAWWVAGYLVFNLFWDNSDDQFWFAILPPLWLCAARALGLASASQAAPSGTAAERGAGTRALAAGVAFLLAANTAFVVAPLTCVDLEGARAAHRDLSSPGMVEIYPGWDRVTHLFTPADDEHVRRIALLDVALQRDPQGARMEDLPGIVEEALRDGRRVVVARLYDRDRFPDPWEHLDRLDWPRARISALLERFPAREVARIDGLVFRELSLPAASSAEPRASP
jgi:hypothetical protein